MSSIVPSMYWGWTLPFLAILLAGIQWRKRIVHRLPWFFLLFSWGIFIGSVNHWFKPIKVDPTQARELVKDKFTFLQNTLLNQSKKLSLDTRLKHTLHEYSTGNIRLNDAQKRIFDLIDSEVFSESFEYFSEQFGFSILGPSHELLAWRGLITDTFDVDLENIPMTGDVFLFHEFNSFGFQIVIPVNEKEKQVGWVICHFLFKSQNNSIQGQEFNFSNFIGTEKAIKISLSPEPNSKDPLPLESIYGKTLAYLDIKTSDTQEAPYITNYFIKPAWALFCGLFLIGSIIFWSSCIFNQQKNWLSLIQFHFYLFFFAASILTKWIDSAFFALIAIWSTWVSSQMLSDSPKTNKLIFFRGILSLGIYILLTNNGDDWLKYAITQTPVNIWGSGLAVDILPRLMGHLNLMATSVIFFMLLAWLISCYQFWPRITLLFTNGAISFYFGGDRWLIFVSTIATVWLSTKLDSDLAKLRKRFLKISLGGGFLGFLSVCAYYPLAEDASLSSREKIVRDYVANQLSQRNKSGEEQLTKEMFKLLKNQYICEDLARKDSEFLSFLAARYWTATNLSLTSQNNSSLAILDLNGNSLSFFSNSVDSYPSIRDAFIEKLKSSKSWLSQSFRTNNNIIGMIGSPIVCDNVQVGYFVLSIFFQEFLNAIIPHFQYNEVRLVELKENLSQDPNDPRLEGVLKTGERQVGGGHYRMVLLPTNGITSFDQIAILIKAPTKLRRLYNFLWAVVGGALFLIGGLLFFSIAFNWIGSSFNTKPGIILLYSDKILIVLWIISLIPVFVFSPIYHRILEDRLESSIRERGASIANAANIMLLEKGIDFAKGLIFDSFDSNGNLREDNYYKNYKNSIAFWGVFDTEFKLINHYSIYQNPQNIFKTPSLQESILLGHPVASFESIQGETVLKIIFPLKTLNHKFSQNSYVAILGLRFFSTFADELLLEIRKVTGYEIELYSREGYLQSSSRWPSLQILNPSKQMNSSAFRFLGILGGQVHTIVQKQQEQGRFFTTYQSLIGEDRHRSGFLSVSIGLFAAEELDSQLRDVGWLILLVSFLGFFLSILSATVLVQRISRPLNDLMTGTKRIAQGDFSVSLATKGEDEIAQLVRSFNTMVTQLRNQQTELARTHRLEAWAEAARRVAHEIKNPLTPILLSTQHLKQVWDEKSTRFPEFFQKCTDTIIDQVKSLQKIALEFSQFARLPAPRLEKRSLNDAVLRAIRVFEEGLSSGIHIETSLDPGDPHCFIDSDAIIRACVNLIQNSLHAIEENGKVRISTQKINEKEKSWVRLEIKDNGDGMPEEILSRLFEPYFSTKIQGTGLGLAIAKRTFDEHKCSVAVQSQKGTGTTFQIDFPAAPLGAEE